jgi:hypothetical protein
MVGVVAPTAAPTVDLNNVDNPTKVTINMINVQITFTGIPHVPTTDETELQMQLELWFESYFNEENLTVEQQRYLNAPQTHDGHRLVQEFRVPDVRNMETMYDIVTQDITTIRGSNIITLIQNLTYDTPNTNENSDPSTYIALPFMDSMYKQVLIQDCKTNIVSLQELSEISTPVIAIPVAPPNDVNNKLSTGAIFGIVVGVLLGVALMTAGIWKFIVQRNKNENPSKKNNTELLFNEPPMGPTSSSNVTPSGLTTTSVSARLVSDPPTTLNDNITNVSYHDHHTRSVVAVDPKFQPPKENNNYVLTYKDQSRSVTLPPIPTVRAVERSHHDTSVLTIVSAIPYHSVQSSSLLSQQQQQEQPPPPPPNFEV